MNKSLLFLSFGALILSMSDGFAGGERRQSSRRAADDRRATRKVDRKETRHRSVDREKEKLSPTERAQRSVQAWQTYSRCLGRDKRTPAWLRVRTARNLRHAETRLRKLQGGGWFSRHTPRGTTSKGDTPAHKGGFFSTLRRMVGGEE
jgi:hypothetical protein